MNLYKIIDDLLDNGKSGTLATIIKRSGPTPQGAGAKVFIDKTGKVHGTIGGGCVEAEVCKEARDIVMSGESKIINYIMNSTDVANEGMICGGRVDILLEPVNEKYRNFYKVLNKRISNGIKTTVVTKIKNYSKWILENDGSMTGDLPAPDIRPILEDYDDKELLLKDGILIEPLHKVDRLFIYGAGHISQFIARIATMIDFEVTVIDDRAAFASKERFPEADRIIAGYFTEVIGELNPGPADFHVIVTRGHKNDAEVLEEVLKRPSYYVGMIGSKRKIKIVYKYLQDKGFESSQFENIHAPIGIAIDAGTPQEIAVSIAGELVKVRAGKN
jgi:xanthine dehydrogenase accessory factor